MITYSMKIVNEDNCEKTVYVSANSFIEAVNQMRKEYGRGWTVYSYSIAHADYWAMITLIVFLIILYLFFNDSNNF